MASTREDKVHAEAGSAKFRATYDMTVRTTNVGGRVKKSVVHRRNSRPRPVSLLNLPSIGIREQNSSTESSPASEPLLRRVFIAQTPGQVWMFTHSGTPMICGNTTTGPWPQIKDKVEAKRRWIVLVIFDNGKDPPTETMLQQAQYFDCPEDAVLPKPHRPSHIRALVRRIEALQELGVTPLSNEMIQTEVQELISYWKISDSIIWNNQHFALHLATAILSDKSFEESLWNLRKINSTLVREAFSAEGGFLLAKHLGCMAGMAISGVLTLGVGAFGFWAGAGVSMVKSDVVHRAVWSQICQISDNHIQVGIDVNFICTFRSWC
ncbi:hypothetical protein BS50DRAFT_264240 [Corynespora cassiicola Philippines]|uniref:Uncharacterized protein n=1 Tax=Corynespora cassiicola Philippines TaxID=1448308 RepID=A0A2T2NYS6_CORCC|nr:hypothetical protein BS50DRAFT_264240 [Corynespora cassiicola Philippines]